MRGTHCEAWTSHCHRTISRPPAPLMILQQAQAFRQTTCGKCCPSLLRTLQLLIRSHLLHPTSIDALPCPALLSSAVICTVLSSHLDCNSTQLNAFQSSIPLIHGMLFVPSALNINCSTFSCHCARHREGYRRMQCEGKIGEKYIIAIPLHRASLSNATYSHCVSSVINGVCRLPFYLVYSPVSESCACPRAGLTD